jgi:hypothetical protein
LLSSDKGGLIARKPARSALRTGRLITFDAAIRDADAIRNRAALGLSF